MKSSTEISRMCGVTRHAVNARARRLGLRPRVRVGSANYWSEAQAAKLLGRDKRKRDLT